MSSESPQYPETHPQPHDASAAGFGHDPPVSEAEYITEAAYLSCIRRAYVGEQDQIVASSRTTPAEVPDVHVGVWRLDGFKGIHGREIAQLRLVPIEQLEAPELDERGQLDPVKRGDEVRYAEWLRGGLRPPPLEVIETERGGLKITDGHRRLLAAKLAGRTHVEAWVSPMMDHPLGARDSRGVLLRVGATFEAFRDRAQRASDTAASDRSTALPTMKHPSPTAGTASTAVSTVTGSGPRGRR